MRTEKGSDEVVLDLDKLSDYIKSFKHREYIRVKELVEKLSRCISGMRPGEFMILDKLVVSCSEDGFDLQETDIEGESDS